MALEIVPLLGEAAPPKLLIIATVVNVDGWDEDFVTLPTTGSKAFTRRRIEQMILRGTTSPATAQIPDSLRAASYTFVTRGGQDVSPHVPTRVFVTSLGGNSNTANIPIMWWHNPFPDPVRGGDALTVLIPGDANASPVQDWELSILCGKELTGHR